MSRTASNEVSNIGTLESQPMNEYAPKGEEVETVKKEDQASWTPVGEVQYDVDPSARATVQHQAP